MAHASRLGQNNCYQTTSFEKNLLLPMAHLPPTICPLRSTGGGDDIGEGRTKGTKFDDIIYELLFNPRNIVKRRRCTCIKALPNTTNHNNKAQYIKQISDWSRGFVILYFISCRIWTTFSLNAWEKFHIHVDNWQMTIETYLAIPGQWP